MNRRESLIGRRVIHDGTGKTGEIAVEPHLTATSIFVLFDGADHPIPCHPDQIEFLEQDYEYANGF
jgi:hypothetical protein